MAGQTAGKAFALQLLALEFAGGLEAHGIGFRAFIQVGVFTHTKAFGQFDIGSGTRFAVALQFQPLEI